MTSYWCTSADETHLYAFYKICIQIFSTCIKSLLIVAVIIFCEWEESDQICVVERYTLGRHAYIKAIICYRSQHSESTAGKGGL